VVHQESLARRETKGRLVQRVQLVIQVNKALLEKPDLLVHQEMWVKLVLSVVLELQDHLVLRVPLERQDWPVLVDRQER